MKHHVLFIEGRQRFDWDAWIAQNGHPSVVGISTITATAQRGFAIADACRARELLQAMIAERFRFQWSTQVRADVARDPELVRLMKQAGKCSHLPARTLSLIHR